jgi:GABA permease
MWFFPVLSILTVAGIVAVLVQMAFDSSARMQFWLSLLSWAVVVALYFLGKWWRARAAPEAEPPTTAGSVSGHLDSGG